jgi:thioesterase domain-containing protein
MCSPEESTPTNWEFLVEMKRGNPDKAPLFCIHAIWGNILFYRNFTKYLDTDRPIYGIQSRGLNGNQTPCSSIPEMAANYIREIRSLQPQGPYLILGFSLGGLIAFEVAQQLQAQGQEIQLLALLDPTSPNLMELNAELNTIANTSILSKTTDHIRRLLKLSLSDKITYVKERLYWNLKLGRANFLYKAYLRYIKGAITELRLMEVYWANYLTQDTYLPQPYIGKISLFLVEDPGIGGEDNSEAEWGFLASEGVTVELFPGAHIEIMEEPNVRMLCARFNNYLK